MLLNYIKLAIRLQLRNPFFTLINVLGLSLGFAAFVVLWQYSYSELNSDKQWKDWQRIARVAFWWEWTDDGKGWEGYFNGSNSTEFAEIIHTEYPQIEAFTRIIHQVAFDVNHTGLTSNISVRCERPGGPNIMFKEEGLACADANFFEFFTIPLRHGHASTVLLKANSVVISESTARKYFGDMNPRGRALQINNREHEVTGVFEDLPRNTHLRFDMVVSNAAYFDYWAVSRPFPIATGYIKGPENVDWIDFENELNQPEILSRHWAEAIKAFPNGKGRNVLQPLNEVAFARWNGNRFTAKSKPLLIIFQFVGWTILAIAIINFLILNTARTATRWNEVATRKISGAMTRDFLLQFTIETAALFIIAMGVALTLVQLGRPLLQIAIGISLPIPGTAEIAVIATTSVAAIVLTSLYPAYLAYVRHPRELFQSRSTTASRRAPFLSLTTLQYTGAIILIIWGYMIYSQISFLLTKELGFDKEQVVVIEAPVMKTPTFSHEWENFQNALAPKKGVKGLATCTNAMGEFIELVTLKRPGVEIPLVVDTNGGVDHRFIPFFGLQLVAGRNFRADDREDVVIISEGALDRLVFAQPSDAIGSKIRVLRRQVLDGSASDWAECEVIGVVEGYRLSPMMKSHSDSDKMDRGIALLNQNHIVESLTPERLLVRIDPVNFSGTIDEIQFEFNALFPGNVFTWRSLDDSIASQYYTEKLWRNQILFFTGLAIVLSCLGLLGVIANKVVKKTKEVGIRKVLGAGLHQIAYLLVGSTLRQVAVASIVGIPVAHYLINQYLQKFTERLPLQWWNYAVPLIMLAAIMAATIGSLVWKAARGNPIEALKHE